VVDAVYARHLDRETRRAAEFISAWSEFAEWTMREVPGSSWGELLRDTTDENRFVSFGPWQSMKAITAWRALEGWQRRFSAIRTLLEGFEVATLEVAAERG
jgi:quinol monooxygenase YgiN